MSIFTDLLTHYTTRYSRISSRLAYLYLQVYLYATLLDIAGLAVGLYIYIRRSTYLLYYQIQQDQQQPYISIFIYLLTSYTTRHSRISNRLIYLYSQVYLPPILLETVGLVIGSHIHIYISTYILHHQTQQDQQQARISIFIGLLTSYTTRYSRISNRLICLYLHVYLYTIPLDIVGLAAGLHIYIYRSTYLLYYQIQQDQQQAYMSIFTYLLIGYTTRHSRISSRLIYLYSHIYLPPTPLDIVGLAVGSHINICISTYRLHHQTQQDQQQARISIFIYLLTSYTTRHSRISSRLIYLYLHINLPPTPPNIVGLAAALHINSYRSTYFLQLGVLVEYLKYTLETLTRYTNTVS